MLIGYTLYIVFQEMRRLFLISIIFFVRTLLISKFAANSQRLIIHPV